MMGFDYLFMCLPPRAESVFLGGSTLKRSHLLYEIQVFVAFSFLMLNVEKTELFLIDPAKLFDACTSFIVQWVTEG